MECILLLWKATFYKKKIKIMQELIEGYEAKGEPFLSSRYVGISRFP